MTIQYAVFNPAAGEYDRALTVEERNILIARTAYNYFLSHGTSTPYSVVEMNEDGSETWRNPQGEEIENGDVLMEYIKSYNTPQES